MEYGNWGAYDASAAMPEEAVRMYLGSHAAQFYVGKLVEHVIAVVADASGVTLGDNNVFQGPAGIDPAQIRGAVSDAVSNLALVVDRFRR